MKRIFAMAVAAMLVFSCAFASAGYNSFFDDDMNAGYYDNRAWDGEYVYWLRTPEDDSWEEHPNDIFRMRPGDDQAEMILKGRDDLWIYNIWNIGNALLLSVQESFGASEARPALIDFDGGNFRWVDGKIGSVVLAQDVLYNSVGGHIYEIDIETMASKKIYSYPAEIAAQNPVLYQIADDMLYFSTDAHEIFSLYRYPDADTVARKIAEGRGSWFVYNGYLYLSDQDKNNGVWLYNAVTGAAVQQLSEDTYTFHQGADRRYIRAFNASEEGWIDGYEGVIIDISKVWTIEEGIIGSCDHYYDVIFGGKLIHYNFDENLMKFDKKWT